MHYRRADAAGGTYFFTVNLVERHSDLLVREIEVLRAVMQVVKQAHPYATLATGGTAGPSACDLAFATG